MPETTRRFVRLTVSSPSGHTDLAVADDVVGAEIARLAAADTVDDAPAGWELVHPTRGPIPLEHPVGREVLRDGDVLVLRPRSQVQASPPVDDVAEHARTAGGPIRPSLAATAAAVLAVLLAPVALMTVGAQGSVGTIVAVTAVLVGLAAPVLVRTQEAAPLVGAVAIPAVAVCAALAAIAAEATLPLVALAAAVGAWAAGAGVMLATPGRWWRPLSVGLSGLVALLAVYAGSSLALGEATGAHALTSAAVVVLLSIGPRLSLATSGLGALDDRVAAGGHVREDRVAAAVERATDDLTAVTVVVAVGVLAFTAPLGEAGAFGAAAGLTASAIVAARARSVVRPVHALPLVIGGGLAAAQVLVAWIASHDLRAVPVLVVTLTLGAAAMAAVARRGVAAVTAGRARRVVDVLDRLAVVALPLLLLGVFDLYRMVWERF